VYVSMWVFVIRHLNPLLSFLCSSGVLPRLQLFSHSSQAVHPDPRLGCSRPWRLRKTGTTTSHFICMRLASTSATLWIGSLQMTLLRQSSNKGLSNFPKAETNFMYCLNLGCLHPVACERSGDGGFFIRLRNVTIVG
jgi:hypothetical protein